MLWTDLIHQFRFQGLLLRHKDPCIFKKAVSFIGHQKFNAKDLTDSLAICSRIYKKSVHKRTYNLHLNCAFWEEGDNNFMKRYNLQV